MHWLCIGRALPNLSDTVMIKLFLKYMIKLFLKFGGTFQEHLGPKFVLEALQLSGSTKNRLEPSQSY